MQQQLAKWPICTCFECLLPSRLVPEGMLELSVSEEVPTGAFMDHVKAHVLLQETLELGDAYSREGIVVDFKNVPIAFVRTE